MEQGTSTNPYCELELTFEHQGKHYIKKGQSSSGEWVHVAIFDDQWNWIKSETIEARFVKAPTVNEM